MPTTGFETTKLELLYAGSHRAARGQDFPPHCHTCWELVFYRKGNIEVPTGNEILLGRPGLLLCTPPGMVHSERALTAYANDFIAFEAPADTPWPRAVSDDAIGTLDYLCRALVAHSRNPNKAESLTMLPLLLAQFDQFLLSHHEEAAPPGGEMQVRAAEQLFDELFATSLEMRDVAAQLNVSPSALRANFADFRGYSPSEGLLRVRLRHALALLRSSDLSLQQVACASGFYSSSHLSRHVKTATQHSPGQWRRSKQL